MRSICKFDDVIFWRIRCLTVKSKHLLSALCLVFYSAHAHAQSNFVLVNQSVFICGRGAQHNVFSSVDIQTELAFFNSLYPTLAVALTTNWNDFIPWPLPSAMNAKQKEVQDQLLKWPADAKRIVLLCMAWQAVVTANASSSDQESKAERIIQRWQKGQDPWPSAPKALQKRWQAMDTASLSDLVVRVLFTADFLKKQGDLNKAIALWYTPIAWIVHDQNPPE